MMIVSIVIEADISANQRIKLVITHDFKALGYAKADEEMME